MFQVAEIRSLEDLQAYRLAWNDLWLRSRCQRYSTSFLGFQEMARQHSGGTWKILVISLGGRIIGMLPLTIKTVQTALGRQRLLTYFNDDCGNWFGPIGPNAAATLTASFRYLSCSSRDWDYLDLQSIDRDRLDLGRTQTAARNLGWMSVEQLDKTIPAVHLQESWETFLNRKQEPLRQEILNAQKAIDSVGEVRWIRYRTNWEDCSFASTSEELEICQAALLELANQNLAHLKPLVAHLEAAEKQGLLDLAVLFINNQPAVACWGTVRRGEVEIHRSYNNNRIIAASPLLPHQLESAFLGHLLMDGMELGDTLYEFHPLAAISETARVLWANDLLRSFRYTLSPLSHLRGAALVKFQQWKSPRIPRRQNQPAGMQHLTPTELTPTASIPERISPPALKIYQA